MVDVFAVIVICVVSAAATFFTIPASIWFSRRAGAVGLDVHKPKPYEVPKLGGLALAAGISSAMIVYWLLTGTSPIFTLFATTFTALAIGLFEDFREINPILKPLLISLAGIPFLVAGTYSPNPELPFIGTTRLTIVYPFLILVGFAVVCNAVNSIDVLNGSMALTSLFALLPLAVVSLVEGKTEVFILSLATMVSLSVFLTKNYYPAKTFAGNVGSLYIGAVITYIAIVGRMEVVAIVALMPQIMNEFHIIYSMRGLKSGKNTAVRPTVLNGSYIQANPDRRAAVTLLRMLTAGSRLTEKQAVNGLAFLSLYSSFLALLTYFLLM
ncbi:MAG: hypothetical protein QXF45_04745 [Candidatus Caldarchaeum sp.]